MSEAAGEQFPAEFRRGRILRPGRSPDAATGPVGGPVPVGRLRDYGILLFTLPFFGQIFHYMIDVPPAYALSKAWPFLTLPIALIGVVRARLPMAALFLVMLAYVLAFTPLISMVQLGNGFLDAMATTVKAWPFAYYFSMAGMLVLLRPSVQRIEYSLVLLGAGTFILMVLLSALVPASTYVEDGSSKLFIFDRERGLRLYMPIFFANIFMFLCTRHALARAGRLWLLGLVVLMLLAEILIYKQRTSILASILIIGLAVLFSLPGRLREPAIAAGLALATAVVFVIFSGMLNNDVSGSLGGSLSVRQNSFQLAMDYIMGDPWRFIFGSGTVTRVSEVTLADIFGNNSFFLADLGWIGTLFEYGAVGALLLAIVHIYCLVLVWRASADGDPLALALRDYTIYILLTTIIYSVTFTSGEIVAVTALAIYLARQRGVPGAP